jgi:prepilin peptidase CpaA
MFVHSVFIALLLVAALYDLWRFRIPNLVTAGLAALFLVAALPSALEVAWLGHLGAGALMLLLGAAAFRFRVVGGGDVKLLAATSLWLGFGLLPHHVLLTAVLGLGLALVLLVLRRVLMPVMVAGAPRGEAWLPRGLQDGQPIPYGIAIAASALVLAGALPPNLWVV